MPTPARRRRVGPAVVAALPLANLLLWLAVPPDRDGRPGPAQQLVAEAAGSTVVVLFATALVLATRARPPPGRGTGRFHPL